MEAFWFSIYDTALAYGASVLDLRLAAMNDE
jgi:hypothetical protein